MDLRKYAAVALFCLLAGCRVDPSVGLLEAELRWVEDQYYLLEDAYQVKCQELASARLANRALQSQTRGDGQSSAEPIPRGPRDSSRRPRDNEDNGQEFRPPVVEGPDELFQPTPDLSPMGSAQRNELLDPDVTHVVLNPRLSGGYDRDGKPGSDGVMIVLEPRNAAGQYVPLAGPISIEVIDPNDGASRRVAYWELNSREVGAHMHRSMLGEGIHLELAWPDDPPRSQQLQLVAGYTTVDGRRLQTRRDIFVLPSRQASARWTPSASHGDRTDRQTAGGQSATSRFDAQQASHTASGPPGAVPTTGQRSVLRDPVWKPFR